MREGHVLIRICVELVVRVPQRAAPASAVNHHGLLPEQPLGPFLPRRWLHVVSIHAAFHLGAPEHVPCDEE